MRPTLTLDLARGLADVAERTVEARGFAMFVAIVDASGTPLLVHRYRDAQPASYEIALKKAVTALKFRRPTKAFENRVVKDGRVNLLSMPGILAVEGGLPLVVDGACVGAIGVSGGTGEEDGEVGAAAAAALPGLLAGS